jgi:CTP:molybdopterin cytidylyltransferase MocA
MAYIAGLVLAAGEGKRFGRPKAIVKFEGVRLVDRAVGLLAAGGCDEIWVVLGAVMTEVPGARGVFNKQWRTGMGSSLRVGLSALPLHMSAAVMIPVDAPWLAPESIARVITHYQRGALCVVATYNESPGHPVLLARSSWAPAQAAAIGDRGARPYLDAHPDLVTTVACDDVGNSRDIDTPEDMLH